LKQRLLSGEHSVVHIASHGVFGDSADDTFIMTFDELLTLDGLQALLRDPGLRRADRADHAVGLPDRRGRRPRTAGHERHRAQGARPQRAGHPVAGVRRRRQPLMAHFYRLLAEGRHSKAGAARGAGRAAEDTPRLRHPFYWAPFILIGDWQ
jgi:CHAT domain-containing protein